jgi:hypothetical protein
MSRIDDNEPSVAWAHATGALDIHAPIRPQEQSAALERSLIAERISRYCWAYDERRADLLGDCFTDDALWEGSVAGTNQVGPMRGREAIVRWLTGFWPYQHDQRRHMVLNTVIQEQNATDAVLLCYLLLLSAKAERASIESIGFYRLALANESGQWRISHLFGGFDVPFWPGKLEDLGRRGRARHGLSTGEDATRDQHTSAPRD